MTDRGVWGLIGSRGAGKSSTLGSLALQGHGIFADDTLVLEGLAAFAGPRSVDLRTEAAKQLGVGDYIGVIGNRERWRVQLDQVPAELPLAGWVFLEWGDELRARSLSADERVPRLAADRGIRLKATDPSHLLQLTGLPMWAIQRPKDWACRSEVEELLLSLIG